jgi:hypothetical protein
MTERLFSVRKGGVKVRPFEGGVGWNMVGGTPHLFAWGLRGRKIDKLDLTESELIDLNQNYHKWSASVGCGKCELFNKICSGLQPKPFRHVVSGRLRKIIGYEANFDQNATKDVGQKEITKLLNNKANCKPNY